MKVEFIGYGDLFTTGEDTDTIWIEYASTSPIGSELFTKSFQRIAYLVNATEHTVKELPELTQSVKYSLVDCSKDFVAPAKFLTPVEQPTKANNVIDVDGLGSQFIGFHEPGIDKLYNFTLAKVEQKYPDVCGNISYTMELLDPY